MSATIPYYEDDKVVLFHGDCNAVLAELPENSIDAVVCDPPYGLEFMGKAFDTFKGRDIDPAFCHWFAGFTDGEGCFSVHKKSVNGHVTYDCQFSISLRADDRPILEHIQRELGIGTLSNKTAHVPDDGTNPKARFSVSSKQDCLRLRDIFRAFPLRAKKAKDFEIWSDALQAWSNHDYGGSWDDVADARKILMESREYSHQGIRISPFHMWCWRWSREVLRVLKPGGHLLAFGGSRTYHRLACAIEDAGFEIRDQIMWVYGSGMPKSLDVSKAFDKDAGVEFESEPASGCGFMGPDGPGGYNVTKNKLTRSGEASYLGKKWKGWGTALKPAHEPIVVARKPLIGTVIQNVEKYGTGAINIDACRIEAASTDNPTAARRRAGYTKNTEKARDSEARGAMRNRSDPEKAARPNPSDNLGRWPANLITDGSDEVLENFPVAGTSGKSKKPTEEYVPNMKNKVYGDGMGGGFHPGFGDKGSAARFFYTAKTSKSERGEGNNHPTVKPQALMRYLIKLVAPPNGTVLDPFAGSGSTLLAAQSEGFKSIGIEQNEQYCEIAMNRIIERL